MSETITLTGDGYDLLHALLQAILEYEEHGGLIGPDESGLTDGPHGWLTHAQREAATSLMDRLAAAGHPVLTFSAEEAASG